LYLGIIGKLFKWVFGGFFMKNEEINDLIFRELIKRGYSIEGNTRIWNIADSKLWYLTPEQAQAYLDVEDSEQYQENIVKVWYDLLDSHLDEILKELGTEPINVVDLGCGDGKKSANLIKKLKNKKIRYCPIDISSHMVKKAIETFSNMDVELIEFKYNISDFENLDNVIPLLVSEEFKKNVFLLLGNTLGNFEINELLYEIRSSMSKGDVLMIGTGIESKNMYGLAESYSKNEIAKKFLSYVPVQFGLEREDFDLDARFANSRIELFAKLNKGKVVKFQDKKIEFKKGDEIIILVAYKHKVDDLKEYLNIHFDQVEVRVSKDESTALCLCKKGRE
jgi:uncharacterized SAM-dependent methyltransferase